MNGNEVEDLKICSECGGSCCKNMACHFSPDDFQRISFKTLKIEIEKGHISIDWWYSDIDEKKPRYKRVYYLRIKNKNANILDPSWGGQCSLWDKGKGCPLPFNERPKGARALIPNPDLKGKCDSRYTKEMCVRDWRKHQTILKRLKEHFVK